MDNYTNNHSNTNKRKWANNTQLLKCSNSNDMVRDDTVRRTSWYDEKPTESFHRSHQNIQPLSRRVNRINPDHFTDNRGFRASEVPFIDCQYNARDVGHYRDMYATPLNRSYDRGNSRCNDLLYRDQQQQKQEHQYRQYQLQHHHHPQQQQQQRDRSEWSSVPPACHDGGYPNKRLQQHQFKKQHHLLNHQQQQQQKQQQNHSYRSYPQGYSDNHTSPSSILPINANKPTIRITNSATTTSSEACKPMSTPPSDLNCSSVNHVNGKDECTAESPINSPINMTSTPNTSTKLYMSDPQEFLQNILHDVFDESCIEIPTTSDHLPIIAQKPDSLCVNTHINQIRRKMMYDVTYSLRKICSIRRISSTSSTTMNTSSITLPCNDDKITSEMSPITVTSCVDTLMRDNSSSNMRDNSNSNKSYMSESFHAISSTKKTT